jgi:hypothetical protein
VMTVPVLIVIGEADDWCPADLCKKMVAHESDATVQRPSGGGQPVWNSRARPSQEGTRAYRPHITDYPWLPPIAHNAMIDRWA